MATSLRRESATPRQYNVGLTERRGVEQAAEKILAPHNARHVQPGLVGVFGPSLAQLPTQEGTLPTTPRRSSTSTAAKAVLVVMYLRMTRATQRTRWYSHL